MDCNLLYMCMCAGVESKSRSGQEGLMNNRRVLAMVLLSVFVAGYIMSLKCLTPLLPSDWACPRESSCPTGHDAKHFHGRKQCHASYVSSCNNYSL